MKKKIIYLISSLDKGGAETHLSFLADAVSKKNFEVTIIYFKGSGYWKNYLEKKKIKIINIEVKSLLGFAINFFRLKKIVEIIKPSIVHCHLSMAEIYGYLLSIFCTTKFNFIISKHLDSFYLEASKGKNFFFKGIFIEKIIFKKVNKIIFISKAVKKYFFKNIKINSKKYSLIYYGLNSNFYKNNQKKKIIQIKKLVNYKKNDLIIGSVSRHVKQKNLDFLIRCFSACYKEDKNLKLILVGSGPLTNSLKKLAKNIKINHRIIWISHIEEIKIIINLFDISCLASNYEGLGLFLLESMLCKKPVLASNCGAIPELIKNNYNGLLFKPNNINSFKSSLKKLKNVNLRKKYGNTGSLVLAKKFLFKTMIAKHLRVYEK